VKILEQLWMADPGLTPFFVPSCTHVPNFGPFDKDQAGDPLSFVPIFHSESTRINSLPTTRRTSPEEEERIQQAT
jgi:hypothetical protein